MQLKLIFTLQRPRAASSYLPNEDDRNSRFLVARFLSLFLFFGMEWNVKRKEFFYERKRLYTRHRVNSSTAVWRMCCICLHRICCEISLSLDELIVLSYDSDEAHSRHTRCRLVGRRKTHTFFSLLFHSWKLAARSRNERPCVVCWLSCRVVAIYNAVGGVSWMKNEKYGKNMERVCVATRSVQRHKRSVSV